MALTKDKKTAVIGEGQTEGIIYNRALIDLARHYGFHPKACKPYRAKTKGKVERPVRYLRGNFVYGRTFLHDADLDHQRQLWLDWRGARRRRNRSPRARVAARALRL